MAKKDGKKDEGQKAKRKLAKAQLKLQIAEEKHLQARARGKQEVEQARLRAARWSAEAAQEVERRADTVARAEARLHSMTNGRKRTASPAPPESSPPPGDGAASSPEIVAERLEQIEHQQAPADNYDGVVLPDGLEPAAEIAWQG